MAALAISDVKHIGRRHTVVAPPRCAMGVSPVRFWARLTALLLVWPCKPIVVADPLANDELFSEASRLIEEEPSQAEIRLRQLLSRGESRGGEVPLYLALAILRQETAGPVDPQSRQRLVEVIELSRTALEQSNGALVAAHVTMSRALVRLGEPYEARCALEQALERVRGEPGFEDMERSLREWLRPWALRLQFGTVYNSNVPFIGRGAALPRDFGRRGDTQFSTGLEFEYLQHLDRRIQRHRTIVIIEFRNWKPADLIGNTDNRQENAD